MYDEINCLEQDGVVRVVFVDAACDICGGDDPAQCIHQVLCEAWVQGIGKELQQLQEFYLQPGTGRLVVHVVGGHVFADGQSVEMRHDA